MITADQLEILKDMFEECDDDWLLSHLSIRHLGGRNFVVEVEKANWQDCEELFPAPATPPGWEPGMPGTVFITDAKRRMFPVHESQVTRETEGKFDKFDPA